MHCLIYFKDAKKNKKTRIDELIAINLNSIKNNCTA